jgi:hypothetical protein
MQIVKKVDFIEVSFSGSVKGAGFWFVFWLVACALSGFVPYGLGAFVPIFAILATINDVEKTVSPPATVGAFVSLLLSIAINDQPGVALYFIAVVLGVVSLFK